MGILKTSNDIVTNSMQLLDNVLSSNFTAFLQGQGTPVLVTYYNLNDNVSTTDTGTYTVDDVLGEDSPLRYNKIENFPVYGLKEIILEIEQGEGDVLDTNFDTELIILPNSIKPTEFDFFVYTFKNGRNITFRVNNLQLGTIRNNDYYKISVHLKDIDSQDTMNDLNSQTVQTFKTNLDTIGTNDKCLIENTTFDKMDRIKKIINHITGQYVDMFYSKRFNSVILQGGLEGEFILYDPFLTQFLINTSVLDNDRDYIVLVNFDGRNDIRRDYNSTLFRSIETKNISNLADLRMSPIGFRNVDTNPFSYNGIGNVFTIEIYNNDVEYAGNDYMNYDFIRKIKNIDPEEPVEISDIENIIFKYLTSDNDIAIINDDDLNTLSNYIFDYSDYSFRIVPIVLFICNWYLHVLNESFK